LVPGRLTFSTIGGSASRTLPLPIRLISVSRPGTLSRVEPLDSSTPLGRGVGPILTPIGLASSSANAMCAPSSWRVRSPIHRKCAGQAVQPAVGGSTRSSARS
jgi:hypothetical protein